MVKLGMGGRALYVLVRAVSGLPNIDPDVKDTEEEGEKCLVQICFSSDIQ